MTRIDLDCRIITIDGRIIRPRKLVFDLMALLSLRPGVVFTLSHIMDQLTMRFEDNFDRSIDKLVQGARKIGVTAIWASYGTGYYWQD